MVQNSLSDAYVFPPIIEEDMAQNVRELYDAWGERIVEMGKSVSFVSVYFN